MDKHMWSDEKIEAFVGFIKEVVVDGMRLDGEQFHPGTFEKLALKMIEKIFNCILTTKHCISQKSSTLPTSFFLYSVALPGVLERKGPPVNLKKGEKLEQFEFADREAIQVMVKLCENPKLEMNFWGFTDSQKSTLTQSIRQLESANLQKFYFENKLENATKDTTNMKFGIQSICQF
ncbi:hypothetical protein PIB30_006451 [Stylosanthes scabra]|uniref:Uncharacterized protein n=1 Tax=Stylosanthes scabra TaxID=79078 RepID=A0ABU6U3B2_9FABA|nr:hypothetical protein [Stylosanthes scabra]